MELRIAFPPSWQSPTRISFRSNRRGWNRRSPPTYGGMDERVFKRRSFDEAMRFHEADSRRDSNYLAVPDEGKRWKLFLPPFLHSGEKLGAEVAHNTGSLKSMAGGGGKKVVDGRTNTRFVAYTCTWVCRRVEEEGRRIGWVHFPSSWRNATGEKVAAITEIVTYAIFPPLVSDRASFYLSNPNQSTAVSPLRSVHVDWT